MGGSSCWWCVRSCHRRLEGDATKPELCDSCDLSHLPQPSLLSSFSNANYDGALREKLQLTHKDSYLSSCNVGAATFLPASPVYPRCKSASFWMFPQGVWFNFTILLNVEHMASLVPQASQARKHSFCFQLLTRKIILHNPMHIRSQKAKNNIGKECLSVLGGSFPGGHFLETVSWISKFLLPKFN